jgi:hypothetical protein
VVISCCEAEGARAAGAEFDCDCAVLASATSVKLAAMTLYRTLGGWDRMCAPFSLQLRPQ